MVAPWVKINEARLLKGISQKEIAEKLGISQTAIQKWKNGSSISYDNLVALAALLNTTTFDLLGTAPNLALHSSGYPPATLREPAPTYRTPSAPPLPPLCRYPADCDLSRDLSQMQTQLSTLSTQVETLTRLLGATLAASANGVAHDKQKAG